MATMLGSLLVSLGLESGQFRSGLTAAEKQLAATTKRIEKVGQSMVGLGSKLSIAVTVPLIALGKTAVTAAMESQDAIAQVNASLKSMGTAAGRTSKQLQGLATGIMRRSLYDDDEILRQVSATMLTFGNVAEEQFDRAQMAAVNLSAKFGKDLQSSALLVGKALNDPIKGLTALSRAGVQFTAQQQQQIKAMVAAGDAAGAQKLILAELEKQLNGSAQAARDANPFAAITESWNEFQEKVGAELLKAMPAITGALTAMLEAFNSLSPGMQKTVVIGLALAAALGPVLIVIGSLVTAFGPLIAMLGALAGSGGLLVAAQVAFWGLAAALAPLLPWIAAFAAAGVLIYANWDSIAPLLQGLGEGFGLLESRVGSAAAALAQVTRVPLFDALNRAGAAKADLAEVARLLDKMKAGTASAGEITFVETLIEQMVRAGKIAPDEVEKVRMALADLKKANEDAAKSDPWKKLGEDIVKFSEQANGALDAFDKYNADAAAKNRARWQSYGNILAGVGLAYLKLATDANKWMAQLYTGIKMWLKDKLDAVWNWLTGKIEAAKKAFYGLYDAVVGHSYIPDMVDGIAAEMARLQAVMVDPVVRATKKAGDAFKELAAEVKPLLDRLFPEAAALLRFRSDMATIDKGAAGGVLTPAQADEARKRLQRENFDPAIFGAIGLTEEPLRDLTAGMAKFGEAANDNALGIQAANVRIVKSFKDMADSTLSALQTLTGAIKGGGFLDILGAVIGLGMQLGSIGLFGKGVQANINKVPAYAGGTSFATGGLSLVGEKGPELVNLPRGSQVVPNHSLKGMGGGNTYNFSGNLMTPEFWAMIQHGDMNAAQAGAKGGVNMIQRKQTRRVA